MNKPSKSKAEVIMYSVYAWSDYGGPHRFFIGTAPTRDEANTNIRHHIYQNPSDHGYKVYRNRRGFYEPRDVILSGDNAETDAETLRALQFALAPLDRAMRDADVESWPRQLMQRTVFPSILQSAEDERRERNLDLEYESRVDYASWQYDGPAEMENQ